MSKKIIDKKFGVPVSVCYIKVMRVCVIYHPRSDHSRRVEEFARDLDHFHGVRTELLSLETREGAAMASMYDVVNYPAIVVVRDSGEIAQFWQGDQLPLMNEVASYVHV